MSSLHTDSQVQTTRVVMIDTADADWSVGWVTWVLLACHYSHAAPFLFLVAPVRILHSNIWKRMGNTSHQLFPLSAISGSFYDRKTTIWKQRIRIIITKLPKLELVGLSWKYVRGSLAHCRPRPLVSIWQNFILEAFSLHSGQKRPTM